jgi:hypothetical protein
MRGAGTDPRVEEALAAHREAMAAHPMRLDSLVEDYARLALHKVGPAEAKQQEALLLDCRTRLIQSATRRPECPAIYFLIYRIYKLMGDEERANKAKELHETRKKEYEKNVQYTHLGRSRCG